MHCEQTYAAVGVFAFEDYQMVIRDAFIRSVVACALFIPASPGVAQWTAKGSDSPWRYYRPGNTGIMGDFCEAVGVDSAGKPWIGGYDPSFEEGGISKFDVLTGAWTPISNVDYREIGHPEDTGVTRVSEIVRDAHGAFWMGTGRGLLYFNPAVGPQSLRRFDVWNSGVPGGWTTNVDVAPDGTVWATAYGTGWGAGGVTRFDPSTEAWTTFPEAAGDDIAIQPKPGGGYFVWAMSPNAIEAVRFDSSTQVWTTIPNAVGAPYLVLGKGCTDSAGNVWMYRLTTPDMFNPVIDVRRPDGTWVNQSLPPGIENGNFGCIRAYGNGNALYADGACGVWKYESNTWHNLGRWSDGVWTDDLNIDGTGAIWACGPGGASRYEPTTGQWQRYRVTNTSQYDGFNNDLTLSQSGGDVFACANAAPGVGGLVKFEQGRWVGFNNLNYGLGFEWPFPTDNASKVYVRPSNGDLLAVPMFGTLHRRSGLGWIDMETPGIPNDVREDNTGRLWIVTGGGVYVYSGSFWIQLSDEGGTVLRPDPNRQGTMWVMNFDSVRRMDGNTIWRRTITDFPELDPQSDQFKGMVIGADGQLWVSANTINLPENGGLFRINPQNGRYKFWSPTSWSLPGQYVMPLAATPDGRVWMQYDSDFLVAERGLVSMDAKGRLTQYPAPSGGEPQWGGLPHAAIFDMEVRPLRKGYELWMVCGSRGIAVLTVK